MSVDEDERKRREFEHILKNTDPVALAVAWGQFVDMARLYPLRECAPKLRLVFNSAKG